MKWNKIILKNFRMFQCFLTWNHVRNEIKLFKEFYFNIEPRLKWNKIILAAHVGIFVRQSCCSQSLHLSNVIALCRMQAPAGRRLQARDGEQHAFRAPAQLNAALNSAHSLKLSQGVDIFGTLQHLCRKINDKKCKERSSEVSKCRKPLSGPRWITCNVP